MPTLTKSTKAPVTKASLEAAFKTAAADKKLTQQAKLNKIAQADATIKKVAASKVAQPKSGVRPLLGNTTTTPTVQTSTPTFAQTWAQNVGGQFADPYQNYLMYKGASADIPALLAQYQQAGNTGTPDWAVLAKDINQLPVLASSWDASGAKPVSYLQAWNATTPTTDTAPQGYFDALKAYNTGLSMWNPQLAASQGTYDPKAFASYNAPAYYAMSKGVYDRNSPIYQNYNPSSVATEGSHGSIPNAGWISSYGAQGLAKGGSASLENEFKIQRYAKAGKVKGVGLAEEAAKLYTQAEKEIAAEKARQAFANKFPIELKRAKPLTKQEIIQHADRVARQQSGEHVVSGKPKETQNLAGRSKKESERLKELEYTLQPTRELRPTPTYESKVGDVNIALPGDQTISDMRLIDVNGLPIESTQEGGSLYGEGKLHLDDPLFWASGKDIAQQFQDKVTALSQLYNTEDVMAHHLAMGQAANDFAMHFADANLRAIANSNPSPEAIEQFNKVIRAGYKDPKGKHVSLEHFVGIEHPEEAYLQMMGDSGLRKWFNNRMKIDKYTTNIGLPSGKDIQWAITEPELRNMEVNLTGHSVGKMKPGAELTDTADHATYEAGIPGESMGRAPELAPFELSFPDATDYVRATQRPQDFTGTIQKVFPHQVIDQQQLDQMSEYYRRLREIRGFAEGGKVGKAAKALEELNKLYKQAEAEKKFEQTLAKPSKAHGAMLQAVTENNPRNISKQFSYGGIDFDNRNGVGAIGHAGNINYMGGAVMMKPSEYLSIAKPKNEKDVTAIVRGVMDRDAGTHASVGSPFLFIDGIDGDAIPKVVGHEGRNRMQWILENVGDIPVPVLFKDNYARAHEITPEMLTKMKQGFLNERGEQTEGFGLGTGILGEKYIEYKKGGSASLEDEFTQANAINMADGGDIIVKGNPYGKGSGRPVHGKMKGPEWDVVKRAGELGAKQLKKEFTQDTPKQTAIDIGANFIADTLGMPADIATARHEPIKSKATPWGNIDFSKSQIIEPKEETHPVFGSETMKRIMKEQGITTGEERPLTEGLLTLATPAVIGKAPKIAKGVGKAVKAMEDLPAGMSIKPVGGQWHDVARDKLEAKLSEVTPNEDVSNWLKTTGRKYMLNRMGTPEDEVRKLLDKDISHIDPKKISELDRYMSLHDKEMVRAKRREAGFPSEGEADTAAGKKWEMMTDEWINPNPAKLYQDPRFVEAMPWVTKVDPETPIYSNERGFGHLINESGMPEIAGALERSIKEGTLKPEQLHKVSMEDAVKLAHDYRVKDEAEVAKDLPKVVDYPEAGMAWHEITHEDPEVLRRILKREGETMQNCIGNYCEDVTEDGTRLFSLRDKSGKPHVNIELKPTQGVLFSQMADYLGEEQATKLLEAGWTPKEIVNKYPELKKFRQYRINQIKGKQNEAPVQDYIPYVQDFVTKQGPFTEIRDLGNAGLIDLSRVKQHGVFDEDIPAVNKELYRIFPSEKNPYGGSVLSGQHGVRISPDVMMTEALKDMEGDYVSTDAILNHLRAQEPRPVEHGYSKYWNRKEHEDSLKHVQQQMEDEGLTDQ